MSHFILLIDNWGKHSKLKHLTQERSTGERQGQDNNKDY